MTSINDLTDASTDDSTYLYLGEGAGDGSTYQGNTGVGISALKSLTTGTDNIAVGNSALGGADGAVGNVAMGIDALLQLTNGTYNTAIGYSAMNGGAELSYNTAIGANAMLGNESGTGSVAVGYNTLGGASGTYNIAVGYQTLGGTDGNVSGSYNIGLGYNAGTDLTSGSSNILIGYEAGVSSELSTGSSNIIVCNSPTIPATSTSNYLNIGGVITGQMDTVDITLADGFKATTQSSGDNSTNIATTAYVDAASGGTITLTGDVTGSGTGSFATTIKSGVALAGSPTTTTQSPGDNTTKIATTAFVTAAVSGGGGGTVTTTGSPSSGALTQFSGSTSITGGNLSGDVTTSGSLVSAIKNSVNLSGNPTTTTQSSGDNSTKIATTAFVTAAVSGGPGASVVYNVISGFLPSSIAGTHTTASFTLSAGQAADSTNAAYISKSTTTSWAASNGNAINGTDAASSTLANSTTYHIFMCSGTSGTGSFVSASLTPTFPTGYNTYKRRVSSFNTNASGAPLPYTAIEVEGGATVNYLSTQVLDISTTTLGTSRTLYTLSVPTGIQVRPIIRAAAGSSSSSAILTSPDETDVAPATWSASTVPLYDYSQGGTGGFGVFTGFLTTNTSGQIGARAAAASTGFYGVTRGWQDFRRT